MVKSKRKFPNNKKQVKNSPGKSVAKRRGKSQRYCKTSSSSTSTDVSCVFAFTDKNNDVYIIFKSGGKNYIMNNINNINHANLTLISSENALYYLKNPDNKNVVMGTHEHKLRAKKKLDANETTWRFHESNPVKPMEVPEPNTTTTTAAPWWLSFY